MSLDPTITPEMKARYISRRKDDLVKLEAALRAGDFATLSSIAHQIKGNASTFSFNELEQAAIALETAAQSGNTATCVPAVAQIKAWVDAQS